jgi:dipicolinate synthase subunit A
VIGFGRTGKALALLLKGLHSHVTVVVRDEVDLARVWVAGYRPVLMHNLRDAIRSADLIFNTAPAMVMPRSVLERAQPDAVLIDLASTPGGTDFATASELGISARLAPGLPGIVAPVTAGRIIADMVLRHLNPVRREEEDP